MFALPFGLVRNTSAINDCNIYSHLPAALQRRGRRPTYLNSTTAFCKVNATPQTSGMPTASMRHQ